MLNNKLSCANKGGKFLKKPWCCIGGSITRQCGFINWVDDVNWPSESLYGGQFTLSTQLIKPKCLLRFEIPRCICGVH